MKNTPLALIPFLLALAPLAQAAAPNRFSCHPVSFTPQGTEYVDFSPGKAYDFEKRDRRHYQMGTDGEGRPYLLEYVKDRENQSWGLGHSVIGMGHQPTTEFGLEFISERVVDTPRGKMAVIEGLRELDIGFSCAIPIEAFRQLGGRFTVADGDLNANHHTCGIYHPDFVGKNDSKTVYLRDLFLSKGYHMENDPKTSEFIFGFGEIQYCYAPNGGPRWWSAPRGYYARLSSGGSQPRSSAASETLWKTEIHSLELLKVDFATPSLHRKMRSLPSCEEARKLAHSN